MRKKLTGLAINLANTISEKRSYSACDHDRRLGLDLITDISRDGESDQYRLYGLVDK